MQFKHNYYDVAHDIDSFLDEADAVLRMFQINFNDNRTAIPKMLSMSICEMAATCNQLLATGNTDYLPIIIRSMLEALAKLIMVVDHPEKLDMLFQNSATKLNQLSNHMLKHKLVDDEAMVMDRKKQIEELLSSMEKYKHEEQMITKCIKENLNERWLHIYYTFCLDAHSDIQALRKRHQYPKSVVYFAGSVDAILCIVMSTISAIMTLHKLDWTEVVASLHVKYDAIWLKYFSEVKHI